MKHVIRNAIASSAAAVMLLALLAAMDPRVRQAAADLPPVNAAAVATRGASRLSAGGGVVRGVMLDHPALTIFAAAGTALVAGMLRL
jgi:hypothetical protein